MTDNISVQGTLENGFFIFYIPMYSQQVRGGKELPKIWVGMETHLFERLKQMGAKMWLEKGGLEGGMSLFHLPMLVPPTCVKVEETVPLQQCIN